MERNGLESVHSLSDRTFTLAYIHGYTCTHTEMVESILELILLVISLLLT